MRKDQDAAVIAVIRRRASRAVLALVAEAIVLVIASVVLSVLGSWWFLCVMLPVIGLVVTMVYLARLRAAFAEDRSLAWYKVTKLYRAPIVALALAALSLPEINLGARATDSASVIIIAFLLPFAAIIVAEVLCVWVASGENVTTAS